MSEVKNDKDAAQGTPGVIHNGADQSGTYGGALCFCRRMLLA